MSTSDRGSELAQAIAIGRATRRCVALHGHVDDLLPTVEGSMLRLPELLAIASGRNGVITVVASEPDGLRTLTPPGSPPPQREITAAPASLGDLLDRALTQTRTHPQPALLLLRNAHSALERDELFGERLRDLPFDSRLGAGGGTQIVVTFRGAAPAALHGATGWDIHHVTLPGRAERQAALDYWAKIKVTSGTPLDLTELAAFTGGLELDDVRRLIAEHTGYQPLTPRRISAIRSAALTRQLGDLIHVDHHPAISFSDVAGGDAVKAAIRQVQREGRYSPIGLAGPPGVGKTMLATAAARELGVPIAYVDGRLKGGIVGETARNVARFREMLIAYAPVVVFWDEIDLLLGRSTDFNGDSGASNEVRQAVLTLLQDAADLDIFIIASSNNPLSAIQYRVRNRLRLIPVLHPTGEEALAIARREAAKLGATLSEDATEVFTTSPDVLWNGRDIARVLAAAKSNVLLTADAEPTGPPVITARDLRLLIRHLATARDAAAELNALEAVYVTDNPYDLPWIARMVAGGPWTPPPPYLTDVVDKTGVPDRQRIAAKLAAAGVQDAH